MPKVKVRVAGAPKSEDKKLQREILFRGKHEPDGSWVWGDLFHGRDGEIYIDHHGLQMMMPYKVMVETVGQYTGLHDKNGVKIFEGDIVRIEGNPDTFEAGVNYIALIAFLDGGFCAIDGTVDNHAFRRYALSRMDFDLEVIGTIYDDLDLLLADMEDWL